LGQGIFVSQNPIACPNRQLPRTLALRDGIVKPGLDGWAFDPYDNNFTRGFLMNLSENSQFDEMFLLHPLSEARKFIKELVKQL
jgi:hypothetical protein